MMLQAIVNTQHLTHYCQPKFISEEELGERISDYFDVDIDGNLSAPLASGDLLVLKPGDLDRYDITFRIEN